MTTPPTPSVLVVKAFVRGFPIAGLSAAGVVMVSSGNLWGVFLTSLAINFWWHSNVRATQDNIPAIPFALGAALGSVFTVWLLR